MNRTSPAFAICLLLVTATAFGSGHIHYPSAFRDKTVDTYFGVQVPAPYQWMEKLTGPKLHKWVKAENKVTAAYFAKIPLRGWIERRLTKLWNYPKETTPTQLRNGMLFFRRNSGLQNQSAVYVQVSPTSAARALLDPNKLSPNGSIALAAYAPSPDGKYLAYALSKGGTGWETIHVMDVATGKQLPDVEHWVEFSGISWTRDDKGFFYSRFSAPPKGEKRISHAVGWCSERGGNLKEA